jgi:hypothetical protein
MNSVIARNTAGGPGSGGQGGGLFLDNTNVIVNIKNSTIAYNSTTGGGDTGGGIAITNFSDAIVANTVVWGNTAASGAQIYTFSGGSAVVSYSDVQGGYSGTANINLDPQFENASGPNYSYKLLPVSPCINVGNNNAIPQDVVDLDNDGNTSEPTPLDLDRLLRKGGTACIVDMGAYELLGCAASASMSAVPPNGTHDARQPHPEVTGSEPGVELDQRQGIGRRYSNSAGGPEPIVITLDVCGAGNPACWQLCETGIETVESPTLPLSGNFVWSVTESVTTPGTYSIVLNRPISAGHWTTIGYTGGTQTISYASLPADANADGAAVPVDILNFLDCCLNGVCTPPYGENYSCDIDHSGGEPDPQDQLTLTDLLNGAGEFIVWNGKSLPPNTCAGAGLLALGSAQLVSAEDENREFADWFVNYLTTANPIDATGVDDFHTIVGGLTQWCVDHFSADERAALAARLSDPTLTFASEDGRAAAAGAVTALVQ